MKSLLIFIGSIIISISTLAQNELKNTYSTISTIYSGVEDGGVSITETYTFKAQETIIFLFLYYENNELKLKKGEQLNITVKSYHPYSSILGSKQKTLFDSGKTIRYDCTKREGIYYLNINKKIAWTNALIYLYRKKEYQGKTKDKFDSSKQFAMP